MWKYLLVALVALGIGAGLFWVYTQRKALAIAAKNRQALGGVVGAVADAGALADDVKSIFSAPRFSF